MVRTVFIVGYEGMSIQDFVALLKYNNVRQLIDVRELPLSRKPGFSKKSLQRSLENENINYHHNPVLGSPRWLRNKVRKDGDYKSLIREYKAHAKSREVQDAIKETIKHCKGKKTVLLCFEQDPSHCHRSVIADLMKKGSTIQDLRMDDLRQTKSTVSAATFKKHA